MRINASSLLHQTTKFARITWVGESVPATRKALVTTHKGRVDALIGPAHVDVHASAPSDLSSALIVEKIKAAAGACQWFFSSSSLLLSDVLTRVGTADHVLGDVVVKKDAPAPKPAAAVAPKKEPAPKKEAAAPAAAESKPFRGATGASGAATKTAAGPGTPGETKQVTFEKEDECRQALAEVRKSNSPNDWALLAYVGQTSTLQLIGTGACVHACMHACLLASDCSSQETDTCCPLLLQAAVALRRCAPSSTATTPITACCVPLRRSMVRVPAALSYYL